MQMVSFYHDTSHLKGKSVLVALGSSEWWGNQMMNLYRVYLVETIITAFGNQCFILHSNSHQ